MVADERRDIDEIISKVAQALPTSWVRQLEVKYPDDDDGIWFFWLPDVKQNIQIESSFGMCPFIVETDEQSSYDARKARTVDEAVSMIVDYLNSKKPDSTN